MKLFTADILFDFGFNEDEIRFLQEKNFIEKVSEDCYSMLKNLQSMNYIYKYFLNFNRLEGRQLVEKVFRLCQYVNPHLYCFNYELFLICLRRGQLTESLEYLKNLLDSENIFRNPEYLLFLYVLSVILDLPEPLKSRAKEIKEEDILILESDLKSVYREQENALRTLIYKQKFSEARRELVVYSKQKNANRRVCFLLAYLLSFAINKKYEVRKKLSWLIKYKKYASAIKFLEAEREKHVLSRNDEHTLMALCDLLMIKYLGEAPSRSSDYPKQYYRTIEQGAYRENRSIKFEYDFISQTVLDKVAESIVGLLDEQVIDSIEEKERERLDKKSLFLKLLLRNISIDSILKILNINEEDKLEFLIQSANFMVDKGYVFEGNRVVDYCEMVYDGSTLDNEAFKKLQAIRNSYESVLFSAEDMKIKKI